ncbi:FecR domain-containing protein [Corticimicrobacter populi]|uniref:Iron dicitrate transport regulator FecR n=1 Tax=Corticimicrobacter populi TaxID=2175229 RepID=A0A2V1JY53_9BURK|nr:FecR domain-containing protein [Corticimicrobacter populi]PWF22571.1 iron dicitrate transport regulator FecR [Corticimicrobacter populi]
MTPPSHQVLEQAAHWYTLLESGSVTEADRQHWQDWLNASEQHQAAWGYAQRVGQQFSALQGASARLAADTHHAVHTRHQRRRQLLGGMLILAGSGAIGSAAWQYGSVRNTLLAWGADHSNATGEIRRIILADGSELWLGSASAIDLDFDPVQRRIELLHGEVLIQTAQDPAPGRDSADRPFIVQTTHGVLQALGTRFSVQLGDARSLLAVYEGAVRITPCSDTASVIVPAGEQAFFDTQGIAPPQPADPNREAWARNIFIAERTPLHELIAALRRYHAGHIGLDPDIADLPVLGSYPLSDTEQALRMLERVLPIRVRQPLPWWVSIGPR